MSATSESLRESVLHGLRRFSSSQAASDWITQQTSEISDRANQAEALQARLEEIEAERVRTFQDGGRLGLDDHEVSHLLKQLAEERQQVEQELAATQPAFINPSTTTVDQIDHIIEAANLRLRASDEDTRAEILDLLDVEVHPTAAGYTVQGTIPLDPGATGNISTPAPRHHVPPRRLSDRVSSPGSFTCFWISVLGVANASLLEGERSI